MINLKEIKKIAEQTEQLNQQQNRRLSTLLARYRNRANVWWCPRCWIIRLLIIATVLLIWFWI